MRQAAYAKASSQLAAQPPGETWGLHPSPIDAGEGPATAAAGGPPCPPPHTTPERRTAVIAP
jgi:hypothetical protein